MGAKLLRLRVELGSDEDTLSVTGSGYYGDIHGNGGDDTITDGNGSSTIYGDENLGGNDVIDGGGGNDVIYGGKGADDITGGAGNDRIHGQQGNDVIHAVDGAADAVLGCGPDADTIHVDPQDAPSADCETVL